MIMTLDYSLPKTGHPNCRRPDKVIDAGQRGVSPRTYAFVRAGEMLNCHGA